jgi:hypothetical protein
VLLNSSKLLCRNFLRLKNADLHGGSIESWGAPTDLQRARQQIIGFGRFQPWQAPKAHRPHKRQNISQNRGSLIHFHTIENVSRTFMSSLQFSAT